MVGIVTAMEAARAAPLEIGLPLLLLVAPEDAVVDAGAALAWAAEASADVSVVELPGARHEILNDLEREVVFARICDWCDARAG
jgi:alpha-beta hydrolase superfamily lysophospholipase